MTKKFVILTEGQTILGREETLDKAITWAKASAKSTGRPFQVAEVIKVIKAGEAVVDEA